MGVVPTCLAPGPGTHEVEKYCFLGEIILYIKGMFLAGYFSISEN